MRPTRNSNNVQRTAEQAKDSKVVQKDRKRRKYDNRSAKKKNDKKKAGEFTANNNGQYQV